MNQRIVSRNSGTRIAGSLVGDIRRQPDMRIKYSSFFEAVARRFELLEVYDANLRGAQRYWNALQTFTPSISRWKERFFKNVPAFQMRSLAAQRHFYGLQGYADVILQLGALFDVTKAVNMQPVVLYIDNTTRITAQHPDVNRYPFEPAEYERWLDHETRLYRHVAHICTRASIVKRSLIDDYSIPAERISIIGGGVNFRRAASPEVKPHQPGSEFTVLFIGTDFHRKGGDVLLAAFGLVRKLYPFAQLILVTQDVIPAGFSLDGVRVFKPIWERAKLEALYRQADVFVLPARFETWGDVLLEAMSFELPCIGVIGQAMEDIIVDGETGFLIEPEQVESLAQAIIQILEQPDLRHRMGQAARRLVDQEFTWDRVVDRLAPILEATNYRVPVSSRNSLLERMSV
jgi:glycosyltransferase involved in cell wall biosynthesis